jgi:GrpB-like predicted nucleotidyltransferase (UPF0157 family)
MPKELRLSAVERILVLDSDPRWPEIAVALMAELQSTVSGVWEQMEHIGSTSVPGLPAKPVIDLMASTRDLDRVLQVELKRLSPLGYIRLETGMTGRLFYRRESGTAPASAVAVHLHVVPVKAWDTQNERLLRDLLLVDSTAARRYGDLKRRLAGEITESLVYTRAKTELIQELVDQARRERNLPPTNVWPD